MSVIGEFCMVLRGDATSWVVVAITAGFTTTETELDLDGLNEDVPA